MLMVLVSSVVAIRFAVLWCRRRRNVIAVTAVLWALYALYEYLISTHVLCSGDCNIRVDLLLIFPILLFASYKAARSAYDRP